VDRRARKKAQTREHVRTVAQRLFAERGFDTVTIADVARDADVAVQTVFNHFASKEELFFDGHTPWVDGPAEAVRSRGPGVAPLAALRSYLVQICGALVGSMGTEERRRYMATLQGSDALRAHERELVYDSERRLTEALLDAWGGVPADGMDGVPAQPGVAAPLVAAIWLTAGRVLIVENRPLVSDGADAAERAGAVEDMAQCLFAQMETALAVVNGRTAGAADTDWPQPASSLPALATSVRRAG
jgi:AcrR family transcriptional regulator